MANRRVAILGIVLLGAILRWPGLFTDFWLDEIWSYDIARGASDAHIDNNHLLNTWLIKAIGTSWREWWIYRIPPMIFGVATIALAAHTLRRRGTAAMIIAAILFAISFPFVFYSTEARGYAMAAFFAIAALDALFTEFDQPRWYTAVVFNLACVLGFLSHLTFVHFYFAAMIWSFLLSIRSEPTLVKKLARWLRLNLPVIVFGYALYHFFIRDITIGGAANRDPVSVLFETISVPFGGPPVGLLAHLVTDWTMGLFLFALMYLFVDRNPKWLLYLLAVVIAPMMFLGYDLLLSQHPQPLMLRYFLVALSMLLIALADVAGALWKIGPAPRVTIVALLLAFAIASTAKVVEFYDFGRGGYSRAIARMYQLSPDPVVSVDADNEFASGRVVDFYAPRLAPAGRSMDFRHDEAAATRATHPPEWVIVSKPDDVRRRDRVKLTKTHEVYRLDSEYPSTSLSGISWLLYRIDIAASVRARTAATTPSDR